MIGVFNEFTSTQERAKVASCRIGKHVHVTNNHFFDASGEIVIKDCVRVAGRGSQREKTSIILGEKCYIASAVRFSQGVEIAENTFVGLGSVVVDSFETPNVLIFGNPAKIKKTDIVARLSLANDSKSRSKS